MRGTSRPGQRAAPTAPRVPAARQQARRGLPPGQHAATKWPVVHYGPIPRETDPESWQIWVTGATESGTEKIVSLSDLDPAEHVTVRSDLHCVNSYSVLDLVWSGWPARVVLDLMPPRADVTAVLVSAQFGYSANLPLSDLLLPSTLLATGVNGASLSPERGGPVRLVVPNRYAFKGPKWLRAIEYLTEDRRGFWEERGYHNRADPWAEQRYSYQEAPGDGPDLSA